MHTDFSFKEIMSKSVRFYTALTLSLICSLVLSVQYLSSKASLSLFMAWLVSLTLRLEMRLWSSDSSLLILADSANMVKFWELSLQFWSLGLGRGLMGIMGGWVRWDMATLSIPSWMGK